MTEHRLFDEDYVEFVQIRNRPTMALIRWGDEADPANWGFMHRCAEWPDEQEPDGTFVKVVAPKLTNHTITTRGPGEPSGALDRFVTVRASILCRDCGVHGFVTDSMWEGA